MEIQSIEFSCKKIRKMFAIKINKHQYLEVVSRGSGSIPGQTMKRGWT